MAVRKLFKTPTLGGVIFWADKANVNGWRVQYNDTLDKFSPLKPYRLLDPDDYLIASSDDASELLEVIDELAEQYAKRDPFIDYNQVAKILRDVVTAAVESAVSKSQNKSN